MYVVEALPECASDFLWALNLVLWVLAAKLFRSSIKPKVTDRSASILPRLEHVLMGSSISELVAVMGSSSSRHGHCSGRYLQKFKTGLRQKEMDGLSEEADGDGNPDASEATILFDHSTAHNRWNDRTDNRTEASESHGLELVRWEVHVRHHAKRDGASSGRKTTECASHKDSRPTRSQRHNNHEAIDQKHRRLNHPFPPKFLGEWRPELTAKSIHDQENHLSQSSRGSSNVEFFRQLRSRAHEDRRVVILGNLH